MKQNKINWISKNCLTNTISLRGRIEFKTSLHMCKRELLETITSIRCWNPPPNWPSEPLLFSKKISGWFKHNEVPNELWNKLYFKGEVFICHLFSNSMGIGKQRLKINKKYVKLDFQIESKKNKFGARWNEKCNEKIIPYFAQPFFETIWWKNMKELHSWLEKTLKIFLKWNIRLLFFSFFQQEKNKITFQKKIFEIFCKEGPSFQKKLRCCKIEYYIV